MGRIVLCADTESLMRPKLIGLEEPAFDSKDWLVGISNSAEARAYLRANSEVEEAWIVSSDDLAGINLAAAIRKDRPDLPIYLVAFDATGSELSRASQAGVTATLSSSAFCKRFEAQSRQHELSSSSSKRFDSFEDETIEPDEPKLPSSLQTAVEPRPINSVQKRDGNAFVISFLSGSGGVGKSTVCAVSAFRAALMGYRTVVVDCDMQFGDLHQVMGKADAVSIDDVLADPSLIERLSEETSASVPALVRAPSRLERSEDLSKHLSELMGICSSEFEVVLVNTGSSWMESHAQLLDRSAASVFLIDQRASSVHACRHALDLCMRLGIASASFVYALNRCKRGALFSSIDIANALHGAHVVEIRDGGAEVEELLGAGLVGELAATRNDLCLSIDEMLQEILPANMAARVPLPRKAASSSASVEVGRRSVRRSRRKVGAKR